MQPPTSTFGVGVFVVLVLPGVVFSTVRSAVAGDRPGGRDLGHRLLEALLAGSSFAALYLMVLGDRAVDLIMLEPTTGAVQHPRTTGAAVLTLSIGLPAFVSFLAYGKPGWMWLDRRWFGWVGYPYSKSMYRHEPTAWEFATTNHPDGSWVRVRLAEGKWVGGWWGSESFASSYPEPNELYIESQHKMNEEGTILEEIADTGVWLRLGEGSLVEWIQPDRTTDEERNGTE